MNDQEIHDILESIAQEEIADDMQLWNKIESQLNVSSTRRITRLNRIGRAAVYLLAALALTTVGYAFYQQLTHVGGDPGIIAVKDLVTPIDETQRHPTQDVNITLLWVYADGHRAAFEWQADYPNTLGSPFPSSVRVLDANGVELPTADFMYGGGGGGGGDSQRSVVGSTFSFDTRAIQADTENITLKIEMDFGSLAQSEMNMGGGSGGGGGGGSSSDAPPTTPEPLTPIEPFTVSFDVTAPFIAAQAIDTALEASANDITIGISDVSYAPSVTLAKLCHSPIDREGTWTPRLLLNPNNEPEYNMDYAHWVMQQEPTKEGEPVCGDLVFFAQNPQNGVLRLVVDGFISEPLDFTPERVAQFERDLETQGFEITIEVVDGPKGMSFSVDKAPESAGENYYTIVNDVYNSIFYETIDGTWDFEIPLPR